MDLDLVELDDWEVLPSEETRGFEVINNDSGVLIRPDYFDSRKVVIQESSGVCLDDDLVDKFEGGIVEKSGIEVGFDGVEKSEVGLIEKSDLEVGFEGVEKIDVGGVKNEKSEVGLIKKSEFEVGFVEKSELDVGFDGVGETEVRDLGFAENERSEVGFLEKGGMVKEIVGRDLGVFENEEIGVGMVGSVDETECLGVGNTEMSDGADTNFRNELVSEEGGEGDKRCEYVDIVSGERESGGEGEKRIMVRWKLPFEFLKNCALWTSPVWTVSMAAAVVGFVILGRRYYSMKKKSRSVQVKVTMDDKNISQFKSRVVRLNEAFLVVKHVPIIRHSLPAAGVTPWPAMTLR
ncbi:uncharacterized protein LOC141712629 [Apium graveolens]|uniref:uncharacterized protein LOC141712629 n=1 Tax=Apium graveolens TaxID=4045 RepID=UPI003D7AA511